MQFPHPALLRGIFMATILVTTTGNASAHCDTMEGPVIADARVALEKRDITPVLKWVKKEKEQEIGSAFAETLVVRGKGKEAQKLADRYFFETLVRLHRAGEGAPYTGLKDEPIEPAIALADKALTSGSPDEMIKQIGNHMAKAIRTKYEKVMAARKAKDLSVEAGREYVDAYVGYTHFIEAIHTAIESSSIRHAE